MNPQSTSTPEQRVAEGVREATVAAWFWEVGEVEENEFVIVRAGQHFRVRVEQTR
jgi:mannose-6-phosphate isomerase-like protein (cupin superfamily)